MEPIGGSNRLHWTQFRSVGLNRDQWISVGNWGSLELSGSQWRSLELNENQQSSMALSERSLFIRDHWYLVSVIAA